MKLIFIMVGLICSTLVISQSHDWERQVSAALKLAMCAKLDDSDRIRYHGFFVEKQVAEKLVTNLAELGRQGELKVTKVDFQHYDRLIPNSWVKVSYDFKRPNGGLWQFTQIFQFSYQNGAWKIEKVLPLKRTSREHISGSFLFLKEM